MSVYFSHTWDVMGWNICTTTLLMKKTKRTVIMITMCVIMVAAKEEKTTWSTLMTSQKPTVALLSLSLSLSLSLPLLPLPKDLALTYLLSTPNFILNVAESIFRQHTVFFTSTVLCCNICDINGKN